MSASRAGSGNRFLLNLYIAFVVLAGAAFLVISPPRLEARDWPGIAAFILLTFWAEATPITLPRGGGSVSVSFWPIYATILLWGPSAGAWVAAIGTIRRRELTGQVSAEKVAFNRGQLALSAGLAGAVYVWLGGTPGDVVLTWNHILPLAACGLTYFVINLTSVVFAMAIAQGIPVRDMWLTNFKWVIPQYVALTPLAIFLAHIYSTTYFIGALMFVAPFMAARYSMQLYIDMRQDYLSTISALIQAVEAKDPYTRGHSESVRRYTMDIAKTMSLPGDVAERLEYASLLHDIGKIGVAETILRKPGRLTDEEYLAIKAHPTIGASIVQKLRLLGQEAGTVRYHHEWYNGRGYPDGLKGEEIPLGARIISVADAYDAMTSDRPYRRTMARQEAIDELIRCSGTQFDPKVVEAAVKALGGQDKSPATQ